MNHFKVHTIKGNDGSFTTNNRDTFETLKDAHFKVDKNLKNNEDQKRIRKHCILQPDDPDELPLALTEIKNALKSSRQNKEPGPDGFPIEALVELN